MTMTTTDPWGIDPGYYDISGQWHPTSREVRQRILKAMGAESDGEAAAGVDPVRVVRGPGVASPSGPGELTLEDGSSLHVADCLPPDLPLGYHEFQPAGGDGKTRIIVAPGQCPTSPRPLWGWAAQLYAVRSEESWGMGDLADLRRLALCSAELGAGLLLVNPLDATAPVLPQQASPYCPGSRRFLNPLYLRVEEVPGAGVLGAKLEELAAAGRALNARRRIDRDAVFRLKQEALRAIWDRSSPDAAFERFCRQQGSELERFAVFCALAARFGGDWRSWPAEYRAPNRATVAGFAAEHAREVGYHCWLQWLLDGQLDVASRVLPLVGDLPIGADPGGADAWVWQDLLAQDCAIGAPPDPFNTQGQNWMLPPFVPHKLRAAGYEPFIQTIRASLRHAAGLRIDHVMGLFRLFWIPAGAGAAEGTYVRYRAEELLAIVALESRRAGAFVVGEDLGTVEPEVREELGQNRVLSFRVVWFESQPRAAYPTLAMAAVTTHDLPTITGLWTFRDDGDEAGAPSNRESMRGLRRHLAELLHSSDDVPVEEVIEQIYRRLAEAPSLVLVATLEDALAVREQPNIPGTTTEWPNWSLALPGGIEALERAELPRRIARALDRSKH